ITITAAGQRRNGTPGGVRTGFPFHPVAGATGTDGHNISWPIILSTQNVVEHGHAGFTPAATRAAGVRVGIRARASAQETPAAGPAQDGVPGGNRDVVAWRLRSRGR